MGIKINTLIPKEEGAEGVLYDLDYTPMKGYIFTVPTAVALGTYSSVIPHNKVIWFPYVLGTAINEGGVIASNLSLTQINSTSVDYRYTTVRTGGDEGIVSNFASFSASTVIAPTTITFGVATSDHSSSNMVNTKSFQTALYDELVNRTDSITREMKYINDDLGISTTASPESLWNVDLPNYASNWTTTLSPPQVTNRDVYPLAVFKASNISIGSHDALRFVFEVTTTKTSSGGGSTTYNNSTMDSVTLFLWNYTTSLWEAVTVTVTTGERSNTVPAHKRYLVKDLKIGNYVSGGILYFKMRGSYTQNIGGAFKVQSTSVTQHLINSGFSKPQKYYN